MTRYWQTNNTNIQDNTVTPAKVTGGFLVKETETTVSGGAVQEIDFTGLDLDTDEMYFLSGKVLDASGGQRLYMLYMNGDTTNGNYISYFNAAAAAGNSSGAAADARICVADANNDGVFYGWIVRDVSGTPRCHIATNETLAAGANRQATYGLSKTGGAIANITQLTLRADAAAGLNNGSYMAIWKVK